MTTRSQLIAKAASLPKGDEERRAILAVLSRKAKVEYNLRSKDMIRIFVRTQIGMFGMTISKLRSKVAEQRAAFEMALKKLKADLDAAGVRGVAWELPSVEEAGIDCSRAGMLYDEGAVVTFDKASYEAAFPEPWDSVAPLIKKAFKGSVIKF